MSGNWSPWKRTTSVLRWTRGMIAMPSCCYCRRPARETECSVYEIKRGTPINEIPYCLPPPQFRCAPGNGCNAAPWSRAGAHLREMMSDGPPGFVRKRDGTRWQVAE